LEEVVILLAIMLFLPIVLTSLLGLTFASPIASRSPYAVKDSHHVPQSWREVGLPAADHVIHLTISLKQGRFAELENHLLQCEELRDEQELS
jgi:tripeptidyl-peptidase-1